MESKAVESTGIHEVLIRACSTADPMLAVAGAELIPNAVMASKAASVFFIIGPLMTDNDFPYAKQNT